MALKRTESGTGTQNQLGKKLGGGDARFRRGGGQPTFGGNDVRTATQDISPFANRHRLERQPVFRRTGKRDVGFRQAAGQEAQCGQRGLLARFDPRQLRLCLIETRLRALQFAARQVTSGLSHTHQFVDALQGGHGSAAGCQLLLGTA